MSSIQERIRKLQSLDSSSVSAAPAAAPGAVASARERLSHQTSLPASVTSLSARAAAFSQDGDGEDGGSATARAAGKIIDRLEAGGDKEVIAQRVRTLEREKPAALAKRGAGSDALIGRRAAFEREEEATVMVARTASGVRDRAGIFEKGVEEEVKERGGLLDRNGRQRKEEEAREAGRRAEEKEKKEQGQAGKAAVKGSLSGRAAMFESGGAQVSGGGGRTVAKGAKGARRDMEAGKKEPEPDAVLNELQEVKAVNKDLVNRLVELTSAFKRLEKSREQLQMRVSVLEKKK